jgi:hypothetical protein
MAMVKVWVETRETCEPKYPSERDRWFYSKQDSLMAVDLKWQKPTFIPNHAGHNGNELLFSPTQKDAFTRLCWLPLRELWMPTSSTENQKSFSFHKFLVCTLAYLVTVLCHMWTPHETECNSWTVTVSRPILTLLATTLLVILIPTFPTVHAVPTACSTLTVLIEQMYPWTYSQTKKNLLSLLRSGKIK